MARILTIALCLLAPLLPARAQVLRADVASLLTLGNLGTALAGAGVAGIAHRWDDDLVGALEDRALLEAPADITNLYGSSALNLPFSAALWGLGRATGHEQLQRTGSGVLRTLAFTQIAVGPLKLAAGRRRPDGSNNLSFPSGHTANGFALARFLHRAHGARVGVPLYLLGAFVGAGRLEDDRHYLSDVVMGAALGFVVGNAVTVDADRRVGLAPRLGERAGVVAWIGFI